MTSPALLLVAPAATVNVVPKSIASVHGSGMTTSIAVAATTLRTGPFPSSQAASHLPVEPPTVAGCGLRGCKANDRRPPSEAPIRHGSIGCIARVPDGH